jgi:DNA repair protein RecO (recombination protein O)
MTTMLTESQLDSQADPANAAAPVVPGACQGPGAQAGRARARSRARAGEGAQGTGAAGLRAAQLSLQGNQSHHRRVLARPWPRGAVAKGAKRPHSKLRGALQTFQPLSLSWSGKSEVRTLTDAEWVGGLLPLEKSALLCGFYLNELLVKLLARETRTRRCSTITWPP